MDKDFVDNLNKPAPSGVIAYTSLMSRLEQCEDDANKRFEKILNKLPGALLCALQNDECLQDIKNVGEKYPDLLPAIFACALGLRNNKKLKEWKACESASYKDLITSIGNRIKMGEIR